jgi:hypothetical protein
LASSAIGDRSFVIAVDVGTMKAGKLGALVAEKFEPPRHQAIRWDE